MSNPTPRPRRDEIPYCVIAFVENDRLHTMRLPESLIHFAKAKGWHVLVRDSEMPNGAHDIDPAQSNPKRVDDSEC